MRYPRGGHPGHPAPPPRGAAPTIARGGGGGGRLGPPPATLGGIRKIALPMGAPRRQSSRASVGRDQTIRRSRRETALPYAMVAPLLVFIGALALYPTVLTAYGAFVHNDALEPPTHFTGLGNFRTVFNNSQVRQALVNTGIYVVFGVVMSVALGIFFAVLLQRRFRGRGIVLALMVLPWADRK